MVKSLKCVDGESLPHQSE